MRVLVVGEISSSRKLTTVETWTDPVKGACISRVKMRKKLGPEQMFKLLLDGTVGRVQINWRDCIPLSHNSRKIAVVT